MPRREVSEETRKKLREAALFQHHGPKDRVARFWAYVDKSRGEDACWAWSRHTMPTGYGHADWKGKNTTAHRIAWEIAFGPIPEGMYVLHHCDNKLCVNPKHLWLGTQRDNIKDRDRKGRQARQDGEHNPNSRLTEEKVKEIRRLYREGVSRKDLSKRFETSLANVYLVVNNKTWRNVKEE